jgi:riboflavin synthase
MFTGIIEGFGKIRSIRPSGEGRRVAIDAEFPLDGTRIGDSIAVNGSCLTAVTIEGRRFEVDVAPETMDKTIMGLLKPGDRVNLERAMKLSGRLDGHLVSGHVDGTGVIKEKRDLSNAVIVTIEVPETIGYYCIKKGSVAIDGISLTINECGKNFVQLSIIPHTAEITSIGFKQAGDRVNIETDMIGKYVERFVSGKKEPEGAQDTGMDMNFLARHGFL